MKYIKLFEQMDEFIEDWEDVDMINLLPAADDKLISELKKHSYILEEYGNKVYIEELKNSKKNYTDIIKPNVWDEFTPPDNKRIFPYNEINLDINLINIPFESWLKLVIILNNTLNNPVRIHQYDFYYEFMHKCKLTCLRHGFVFDHHRTNGYEPSISVFTIYPRTTKIQITD